MAAGGSKLQEFALQSFLGQGTFGVVIKGKHHDQSWSAIKVIKFPADKHQKYLREVAIMANLPSHDNIVSFKESWVEITDQIKDDQLKRKLVKVSTTEWQQHKDAYNDALPDRLLCIRLECLAGDLRSYLRRRNIRFFTQDAYKLAESLISLRNNRDLPDDEQRHHKKIFRDILRGLHFLHERCIMHRDLKPENILHDHDAKVFKITDFGEAKFIESDLQQQLMTMNCGTPQYAAPEQKRTQTYTFSSDVYPLGLILFELLYPCSDLLEMLTFFKDIDVKRGVPSGLDLTQGNGVQLILQMTNDVPEARPSLEYLLSQPWLAL